MELGRKGTRHFQVAQKEMTRFLHCCFHISLRRGCLIGRSKRRGEGSGRTRDTMKGRLNLSLGEGVSEHHAGLVVVAVSSPFFGGRNIR